MGSSVNPARNDESERLWPDAHQGEAPYSGKQQEQESCPGSCVPSLPYRRTVVGYGHNVEHSYRYSDCHISFHPLHSHFDKAATGSGGSGTRSTFLNLRLEVAGLRALADGPDTFLASNRRTPADQIARNLRRGRTGSAPWPPSCIPVEPKCREAVQCRAPAELRIAFPPNR